jgi:D-glycero-alpha-D-manno-heptose 1-phosphate guanylyltransferase
MEAIILAGGLGTRLRSVVADVPKCMAPINNIPFISFIVKYLQNEGVQKFIFSLGYKNEVVINFLNDKFKNLDKEYIIETEPLGTGGAIKKACEACSEEDVLIINADTIFNIPLATLLYFHKLNNATCTLALKKLQDFDRYGVVECSSKHLIYNFKEKAFCEYGSINGGVYALNVEEFISKNLSEKFSFEKDFLEKFVSENNFYGLNFDNYFIDIGIPEDYKRFENDYSLILSKNYKSTNNSINGSDGLELLFEGITALFD